MPINDAECEIEEEKEKEAVCRDPHEALCPCSLNTVTYYDYINPISCICLKYQAEEIKFNWPLISYLINSDFYVNYFIASFSSEEKALQRCSELKQVFLEGCFRLGSGHPIHLQ